MAYITTEKVAEIRRELKQKFPAVKFSVVCENHSSVRVSIMESPFEWSVGHKSLNHFYPERQENPEFVKEVCDVLTRDVRTVSHDGDYGAIPNFYVTLQVGDWDRPHIRRGA